MSSKEAGFTLIELIVAIAILTIGLLAVGSMQIAGYRRQSVGLSHYRGGDPGSGQNGTPPFQTLCGSAVNRRNQQQQIPGHRPLQAAPLPMMWRTWERESQTQN